MDRISKVTRRDIFDLFKNGIEQEILFAKRIVKYSYYGRLDEVEFLERALGFDSIEVYDSRCENAKQYIQMHIRGGDYPKNWIFDDDRFKLMELKDDDFLGFVCEIFHPEVRDETKEWELFFGEINNLLKLDGLELYPADKISGRDVYRWRIYKKEPALFIPFSERNKKDIREKKINLRISNKARHQIYELLNKLDYTENLTNEIGWNYYKSISELSFDNIKQFYIPKNYRNDEYVESDNFEEFIKKTWPYSVLDAIEIFSRNLRNEDFENQINEIFKLNQLNIQFDNGYINYISADSKLYEIKVPIEEYGLDELIIDAKRFFDNGDKATAVEKLWDAFERLKTYYSPIMDKKQSANRIIKELSYGNKNIESIFCEEFKCLTHIGNDFRIRHHETTKKDIKKELHYEYFYKRCMALISVAMERIGRGEEIDKF